ncbi:hypothetical protein MRB53_007749 [Persea americana]|uniref:Uncharacterized protein n=1 Tax=Persea americana TaxID=3435 RepID=A0ACC2MJR8_PERAE|nr:hypothetical protein MRB53_007749 [Persea americana]
MAERRARLKTSMYGRWGFTTPHPFSEIITRRLSLPLRRSVLRRDLEEVRCSPGRGQVLLWSPGEIALLIHLVAANGGTWSALAVHFNGERA